MADLKSWLLGIREKSREIGEVAFHQTELKREDWRQISEQDPILAGAVFNSALERVYDEQDECSHTYWTPFSDREVDALNNETIQIDFSPLYEAIHIYDCLNKAQELQDNYEADRRKQMDLLLPSSLSADDDGTALRNLLANITGFSVIERTTTIKTYNFRTSSQIEALWDVLCARVIDLLTETVAKITEPRLLLIIKDSVMLFMQTIQVISPAAKSPIHYLALRFSCQSTRSLRPNPVPLLLRCPQATIQQRL